MIYFAPIGPFGVLTLKASNKEIETLESAIDALVSGGIERSMYELLLVSRETKFAWRKFYPADNEYQVQIGRSVDAERGKAMGVLQFGELNGEYFNTKGRSALVITHNEYPIVVTRERAAAIGQAASQMFDEIVWNARAGVAYNLETEMVCLRGDAMRDPTWNFNGLQTRNTLEFVRDITLELRKSDRITPELSDARAILRAEFDCVQSIDVLNTPADVRTYCIAPYEGGKLTTEVRDSLRFLIEILGDDALCAEFCEHEANIAIHGELTAEAEQRYLADVENGKRLRGGPQRHAYLLKLLRVVTLVRGELHPDTLAVMERFATFEEGLSHFAEACTTRLIVAERKARLFDEGIVQRSPDHDFREAARLAEDARMPGLAQKCRAHGDELIGAARARDLASVTSCAHVSSEPPSSALRQRSHPGEPAPDVRELPGRFIG